MFSLWIKLIISFSLAFFVSWVAFKREFLTKSGAVATFFLAVVIFYYGGIKWSIPVLMFFLPSSFLSKLNNSKRSGFQNIFEKAGSRDFWQVSANGGAGGILVLVNHFIPSETWFYLYVAYLSIMSADTWATELGTLKSRKTYNVLTFRPVEQGISGGVSLFGIFASLAGSSVVVLSALPWLTGNPGIIFLLIITGLLGSLIDSVLGATVQVQYKCGNCFAVTERKKHCNIETTKIKGISWFNNDWVNFSAGITGILIFYLIGKLFA